MLVTRGAAWAPRVWCRTSDVLGACVSAESAAGKRAIDDDDRLMTKMSVHEKGCVSSRAPCGGEFGNTHREPLAAIQSARVVSAEDALAACQCLSEEGLCCYGVSLEQ